MYYGEFDGRAGNGDNLYHNHASEKARSVAYLRLSRVVMRLNNWNWPIDATEMCRPVRWETRIRSPGFSINLIGTTGCRGLHALRPADVCFSGDSAFRLYLIPLAIFS